MSIELREILGGDPQLLMYAAARLLEGIPRDERLVDREARHVASAARRMGISIN